MHVFIDANIFLSFYHFTNEDLNQLEKVFVSQEKGELSIYLSDYLMDEFERNRENRIAAALKQFLDFKPSISMPYFMKDFEEYTGIQGEIKSIQEKLSSIHTKTLDAVSKRELAADKLMKDIVEKATIRNYNIELYNQALMRSRLNRPPGKKDSLGDSLNWLHLREAVPDGEDIHIVSADGDFYSPINREEISSYLANEWSDKKNGKVFGYRTLGKFVSQNYGGSELAFDGEKYKFLSNLEHSGSFSQTHAIIADLQKYVYFSKDDAEKIIEICLANGQVGSIDTDHDVSGFLRRSILPYAHDLENENNKRLFNAAREAEERDKAIVEL